MKVSLFPIKDRPFASLHIVHFALESRAVSLVFAALTASGPICQRRTNRMVWLKSCPRCKLGDMTVAENNDRLCLQCGYVQHSSTDPTFAGVVMKALHIDRSSAEAPISDGLRQETAVAV